jgi:hypothetical protein
MVPSYKIAAGYVMMESYLTGQAFPRYVKPSDRHAVKSDIE